MFTIKRLNHVVFYVRDAQRSARFYQDVLGFSVVDAPSPQKVFMKANGSDNHHDIGLFGIGQGAPAPTEGRQVGLYHAAWELGSLADLVEARQRLIEAGAYAGESDHGNSLSVYSKDPDGNEFEVFWMVPSEEWEARGIYTRRLDLAGELERRGVAAAL